VSATAVGYKEKGALKITLNTPIKLNKNQPSGFV
jgi:hypothetical protein